MGKELRIQNKPLHLGLIELDKSARIIQKQKYSHLRNAAETTGSPHQKAESEALPHTTHIQLIEMDPRFNC